MIFAEKRLSQNQMFTRKCLLKTIIMYGIIVVFII